MADWPEQERLVAGVRQALTEFLTSRRGQLDAVGPELAPFAESLEAFVLTGGKRLRPSFAYWGWRGAGGDPAGPDAEKIVTAAASLELIQACALIHDDVIDSSDMRRGQPAVHRRFARLHQDQSWHGDPAGFGNATAILVGVLALAWANSMLSHSGYVGTRLTAAAGVYDAMLSEVIAGQYLDLVEQSIDQHSVDRSLRVTEFKTAKYTIERPLHLGAVLADAEPELLAVYSDYAVPLGEAFQLRDDVLGVFGDPAKTGKPAGDDLREGKRTVLIALAVDAADPTDTAELSRRLGDPDLDSATIDRLRAIITESGALTETEKIIADRTEQARVALEAGVNSGLVSPDGATALRRLATAATERTG